MNVQAHVVGEREIELIDYLRVLARWKWLILAGTVTIALFAFVTGMMRPRTYEASVTLLATESRIPRLEGGEAIRVQPPETFEAIIKSQSLALEAIRQFELDKAPFALTSASFLAGHLSVKLLRGTGLITLTATLPDPKLAAGVANFVAQRALELNAQLNQSDTVSAKEYIQRQRDDARTAMSNQQAVLVDFTRTANLESLRMEQKILLEAKRQLAELYSGYTTQIRGLQTDVVELRRALAKQEQLLTLTKSIFQDPALLAATQRGGAADLKALSSIQLKSQEINTVYQSLQSDLITREVAFSSVESQRQGVERMIKDNEKKLTSIARQIADADARLEDLTRNYTLTKTAYELFARKFDEASLSVASRMTGLKIVDSALVPQGPLSRNVVQRTATAAAVSLMTLVVLAFFLEYLGTLRTRDAHAG